MKSSSRRRNAFTLLEIMLVVLIIGLLIGMALKFTGGSIGTAQDVRVRGDLEQIKTHLLTYQMTNGSLPTTEQGLKALISKPETEPKARSWRQLLDKPLRDPWNNEYLYVQPGKHNPTSYDIYSAGQDKIPDTADDIGNWESIN